MYYLTFYFNLINLYLINSSFPQSNECCCTAACCHTETVNIVYSLIVCVMFSQLTMNAQLKVSSVMTTVAFHCIGDVTAMQTARMERMRTLHCAAVSVLPSLQSSPLPSPYLFSAALVSILTLYFLSQFRDNLKQVHNTIHSNIWSIM